MAVLGAITALFGVVGLAALFQPLPGEDSDTTATDSPTMHASCDDKPKQGKPVLARSIRVNVFNAGTRSGLATTTLNTLGERGFSLGIAGNAPSGTKVAKVQVWTQDPTSTEAKLVALQFGKHTVIREGKDLAPGINVVVGTGFPGFVKAPNRLKSPATQPVC
ncbi:MAG: LytR C-terminal domain-containing protein [Nocardioidaceae bacterium]